MVGTIQVVADNQDHDLQGIIKVFDDIKTLIKEVNRATGVENEGIMGLQQDFDTIREATTITRYASESQVRSIQLISENFIMANDKTYEIATATKKQREVSEEMITAMEKVSKISTETVLGVKDVATRIGGISDAVNSMHNEIEMIKTRDEVVSVSEAEEVLKEI
jgi:methyl-accepting chemotaxis protein